MKKTQDQVGSDLKCVNDDILQRPKNETENPIPLPTASTSRKRRCPDT